MTSTIPPIIIETDDGTEAMRVDPSGKVGIGTATPANPLHVNSNTGIRQNRLYLSGGDQTAIGGWSSLTYNAYHNDANTDWVFPDPTHAAVTIEMDDANGTPRFQVWNTTPGNPRGWVERFAIDGISGNISTSGSVAVGGDLTANTVTANGEVVVNNAPGTPTIVLDGNGATIEVGAPGAYGVITVYDQTHSPVCTISGQNGKIVSEALWVSKGAIIGGDVIIGGNLQVNGPIDKRGGGFKIDHPLDPANKYLAHSFVESPDMKNIYDGVAVLDANGEAIVELPEWFAALNRDVRYQLTCIGDYAPVYIARKMQDNRFKIAGGKPEMEVSWQVTGIRQDAWACAHRLCPEEEKPPAEQGYYFHPEENGADTAVSI